jgi:flavin reductase (DIM6/NTAB) family NADH-FMN oxidoreductase RutF
MAGSCSAWTQARQFYDRNDYEMRSAQKEARTAWEPVPAGDYLQAMGQHVASVCVITTAIGEERYGLTATAVCSVSAQPPRLLVCVNRSSFAHAKIAEADAFCVNVLSETQDIVAKAFAGMLGPGADRFGVAKWTILRTGAPALVGAAAAFDCVVGETLGQSTHTVFFGDVVGVSSRLGQDTLLYGSRKFRQMRKILLSQEAGAGETLHF